MLQIYAFTLGSLALAQIAPGPNLLAVSGAALGQGLRQALCVTLGVATAIFFWASLTTFGLSALLKLYPPLLTAMKLVGGGYLVWLAARALRTAWRGEALAVRAQVQAWTPWQAWRRGFVVNMTNPKSAMMWAAIGTFMFDAGLTPLQVLAFAPLGFLSSLIVYGTYSVLFSSSLARRLYARFTCTVEALFGAAFGMLGAALLISAVRDIARKA